ncbi:acyl-CoA dehydrogenase [Streptomyces sp. NPDC048182]|uniref:acyl-CoA dehydrogenase n=1 Tax=Streptomyces sp. NPDC048182 TaxID=3365507 RepID=UPI0037166CDE
MTLLTMQSRTSGLDDAVEAVPRWSTTSELTHQLFDGHERGHLHGTWRALIGDEVFRYRPGLTSDQRIAESYARLKLVNACLDSPVSLARDPRMLASLHEWTGVVDGALGTLAGIHYNLFLGSLLDHDGGEPRDLEEFTSMRRTGTFLCTEIDHGNDAAALQTTCELDRSTGGFVLNTPTPGAQKFMPNTSLIGGPKSGTVAARLLVDGVDHGVCLFLVALTDEDGPRPGVFVRPLPERVGAPVDHCLTAFHQVRLPREALLEGEHGRLSEAGFTSSVGNPRKRFLHAIQRVTWGKLCMSGAAVGLSRAALAIAVRRAHLRTISGPRAGVRVPLAAHRSHHGRLLKGVAATYAMTFLHRAVLARSVAHAPDEREEVERLIAIAKGWITWRSREVTVECRERCGAGGLFSLNVLADLTQNLEGTITAEGDNLVVWAKAAAEMIFGYQAPGAAAAAGAAGAAGEGHRPLSELSHLRDLLAEVERLWQARARTALRTGPSGNPLARWNVASSAGIEMVRAHARLQAADAFLAAIAGTAWPQARALLEDLCRLFLLDELSGHTGDLLAENRMTPAQVRELPLAVDALMERLAPELALLVDAFDLPEAFLARVPLAGGAPSLMLDEFLAAPVRTPAPHRPGVPAPGRPQP